MTTTHNPLVTLDALVADLLDQPDRLLPAVLDLLEAEHPRSQQTYPGHSSIGGCRREAAYGVAGTPTDVAYEPEGGVAAWVGTAVHKAWLPALAKLLHPARIELATTWTHPSGRLHRALPPITGHVDLYRRRSELVLDLKTVSRHQLDRVRRLLDETGVGARPRDLLQVHANAASLRAEGRPCTHVALLYVCTETSADRSDRAGLLWLQPVDEQVIGQAVGWWAEVSAYVDPEDAPRDEKGPGLSWKCDGCAWLRRCWGADAQPGVVGGQQLLAVEDEAVASALHLLATATEAGKAAGRADRAAKADKEFAAAILADTPEGTYVGKGAAYTLEWKRGALRLDQREAADLLELHGLTVPRKRDRTSPQVTTVEVPE